MFILAIIAQAPGCSHRPKVRMYAGRSQMTYDFGHVTMPALENMPSEMTSSTSDMTCCKAILSAEKTQGRSMLEYKERKKTNAYYNIFWLIAADKTPLSIVLSHTNLVCH